MSARGAVAFAPPKDPSEIAIADWTTPAGSGQRVQPDAELMLAPAEFRSRRGVQPSEAANLPPSGETRSRSETLTPSPAFSVGGTQALPTPTDLNKLEVLSHLPMVRPGVGGAPPLAGGGAFFRAARLLPETSRFVVVQKWEGIVSEVNGDTLVARLNDLSQGGAPEEVELPLEELTPDDLPLVEPDAVFYWNIGYLVSTGGQHTRSSSIRFRRLPAWSPGELDAAKARARKLKEELGW